ncbi:MAG: immunoglobulin-like domain-containing protein, partial [Peptostreptococcaceae bacterium]
INASDVELKLNDKFEPLNGVTATDKEDGDLTKEIKVVENTVDTSKEGIYKVVYEVEDSQGLKTTKEIKVVVIKEIEKVDVSSLVKNASDWVLQNIKSPTFGDEWKIFGLSRGNVEVPKNYYETYYNNVVKEVKEKDGELSRNKYTEYSRLIIALTSLGYDPTNVGGYNLVEKIYDLDKVTKQGINGVIFALIALDTNNYEIKGNSNSREAMIDFILDRQLSDGGFALSGDKGEVDITAMAIQSLAKYKDLENVNKAIEKALEFLSSKQLKTGGYATEEGENLESSAQVLVAINELGISAKDERFMKNGKTIVDAMARFAASEGGYKHALTESEANSMATEQALYSLVSQSRLNEGKTSLYDMTDISDEVNPPQPPTDQEEEDGEEEEEDDDGEGINPPTNPNGGNKNPQTSDTSIMHFLGLVVLASVSLIVVNRKKMNN